MEPRKAQPLPPLPMRPDVALEHASTSELLAQLLGQTAALVKTEMELARAEIKADIKSELTMVTRGLAAGMFALWTMDLLLVAAVLAVSTALPAWAAALVVGAGTAIFATGLGLLAWSNRGHALLQRSQRALKRNVHWAKERMV